MRENEKEPFAYERSLFFLRFHITPIMMVGSYGCGDVSLWTCLKLLRGEESGGHTRRERTHGRHVERREVFNSSSPVIVCLYYSTYPLTLCTHARTHTASLSKYHRSYCILE